MGYANSIQINEMTQEQLQNVIAVQLEQMATQVESLYANGYIEEAQLLREEGLTLAAAYDDNEDFFYLQDYTTI